MTEILVQAPRWFFLVVLVYAPWAYGCTRPWAVQILDLSLAAVLGLWLLGCATRRSWPSIHPVLWASAAWLTLQAWWMTANAKFNYSPGALDAEPLSPWLSWAPGSINRSLSLNSAFHLSLVLGCCGLACDLARRTRWRKRLWVTMALAGLALILLGLAQKVTHAPGIFWRAEGHGQTFFATYRYHANAGAFMNIVWPLVAGLLVLSFHRGESATRRVLWAIALIVCLAGAFANTSRASSFIALGLLAVGFGWAGYRAWRGRAETANAPALVGVLLGVAAVVIAVAAFGGLEPALRRWSELKQQLNAQNPRWLAAGVCLKMLPQSGLWGFGPGTFETAFPYFTHHLGNDLAGIWLYAHQDYLQTLVEWGWVGAAFWGALVFGGIVYSAWIQVTQSQRLPTRDRVFYLASLSGILAVLLHAFVDYPLQVASVQLYLATLLGMLWSCRQWLVPSSSVTPETVRMVVERAYPSQESGTKKTTRSRHLLVPRFFRSIADHPSSV